MIQTLADNGTIRLGYCLDNDATVIQFPIANAYSLFGSGGDWYLLNRRPEDENAYALPPSQITTDDRFLYWTVAAYDVAQYGNGECQLQYRIGDVVKMTQKWRTAISSSLVNGGEVPTPYETWLDDLAEIADRAEAATEHYPQIGTNGNWYVWDVNAGEFVDTGFPSGGTTYNSITESGTAGNYDLELDAHIGIGGNVDGSGSASFAGDIVSGTAVKSDNFTGASGGVPITFDAAHGSLDIVNADDGVTVGGNLTVNGTVFNKGISTDGNVTANGDFELGVIDQAYVKGDQNATTLRLYGDTNVYVGSDNDIELRANGPLNLNGETVEIDSNGGDITLYSNGNNIFIGDDTGGNVYIADDGGDTHISNYGDTYIGHSGSSGKAYYNGEEIATKKQYQIVLDEIADGTHTEYSVSGTYKKVVIYTRMPISATQPIMYYKIDGTTRGYTQSNSSYARDGMMIADCSEGLLLSQFCPNANAGSVQALQTYPSQIAAQTSISTVSFSLSSGTEIPSGTIIKVYAIS